MNARALVPSLVVAIAATGCGAEHDGESDDVNNSVAPSSQQISLDPAGGLDGPVMYAARSDSGDVMEMDAEIIGTLELDGECLYTTFEGNRYPVLWPYGTTWDGDSSSVVVPDGTSFVLGGEIHGGGGYLYTDTIGGFSANERLLERAELCAEEPYREIAVMQST